MDVRAAEIFSGNPALAVQDSLGRRCQIGAAADQVGQAVFPVLRFWHDGFALDADLSPRSLRGLVDVYDGSRHIFQCLIVASSVADGELVCDFKRATAVCDRAPLDFWRDENAPVGYLPSA